MFRGIRRAEGFSLVELAIALTIVALVVAAALQQYRYYIAQHPFIATNTNKIVIGTAISNHLFNFGYLPCPSGRTVPPGDVRAGVQAGSGIASISGGANSCEAWVLAHAGAALLAPYCETNPASPQYGICLVSGYKNKSAVTEAGLSALNDPVLIGSLPYFDLGLSISQSLDGWGNRFIYAVSYYETQSSYVLVNGQDNLGSIGVKYISRALETTPGLPTAIQNDTYNLTVGGYPYVTFSAGANGKGAYSYSGVRTATCTGTGWDIQNCSYDAGTLVPKIFFLEPQKGSADTDLYSTAPGVDYFDDWGFLTALSADRDKWTYTGPNAMENKNIGGVAIGNLGNASVSSNFREAQLPATPTAENYKLDVAGTLQANQIMADYFCDANGANCLPQSTVADSNCGSNYITGFANGKVICMDSANITKLKGSSSCPGSKLLTGVDSTGKAMCQF
jgi:hypothetical protein